MTETSHTRSRRASLYGLLLQLVVFAGVFGLAEVVRSSAMLNLAWYLLGGALIWFVALLVFRQRELAALEALDLEELRREKAATGGSEAIFDQEGGGFRVAEARLRWMQRWLVPAFGLLNTGYLAGMGLYLWFRLDPIRTLEPGGLVNMPIAMIVLAVVMLVLFLFSRYASGMGRVADWQLLRACGSYMLGNALGALALIICLGVYMYAETAAPERVLAYVIPAVMLVLAAETLANFVLDIYRPRAPGAEPRACFDSRLLALISEPGGIASTIAEAMNYQFGFEVSQTWFYQLLQRTFVPLVGFGVVMLWLLTCIVVVQPEESAIIERFGRQLNAHDPYRPGFYWKWPWPIEVARKYDTGRLHQLIVGFEQFDAEPIYEEMDREGKPIRVALWDDEKHLGQPHFDFLIPVPPPRAEEMESSPTTAPAPPAADAKPDQALPVNMVRMDVAVQYKIGEDKLASFSQQMKNAHDAMRNIAWEEVVRHNAAADIFTLLGEKYGTAGVELKERLNQRLAELDLGLEVVYVGVQNVHPEPGVSKEFRAVVQAEQEKIAAVRGARVVENQVLSEVAGSRDTALALAQATSPINAIETLLYESELLLQAADPEIVGELRDRIAAPRPAFMRAVEAGWELEVAEQEHKQVQLARDAGLGRGVADERRAAERVRQAEAGLATAREELDQALGPILAEARQRLDEARVGALRDEAEARFALEFWNGRLEELLPEMQGSAAALLAHAQAERWAIEMGTASDVARVLGEREAYRSAPRIYKIRKYLRVLVEGIQDSRKFFLAFDPGDRQVHLRLEAQEQARQDIADMEVRREP